MNSEPTAIPVHKATDGPGHIRALCDGGYQIAEQWENVTCKACLHHRPPAERLCPEDGKLCTPACDQNCVDLAPTTGEGVIRDTPTPEPPPAHDHQFTVGEYVTKPNGYPYPGWVVAVFNNRAGTQRLVVESEAAPGMLHIFAPTQLVPATNPETRHD